MAVSDYSHNNMLEAIPKMLIRAATPSGHLLRRLCLGTLILPLGVPKNAYKSQAAATSACISFELEVVILDPCNVRRFHSFPF